MLVNDGLSFIAMGRHGAQRALAMHIRTHCSRAYHLNDVPSSNLSRPHVLRNGKADGYHRGGWEVVHERRQVRVGLRQAKQHGIGVHAHECGIARVGQQVAAADALTGGKTCTA